MPKIHSLLLFLTCSTTIALFGNEEPATPQTGNKHYRVSIRHIESGGIGYSDGYTTLEGFFAPTPQQVSFLPFLDLRGHVFDNGRFAANAGIGIRALANCWLYGMNVYYDYRNTKHQPFHQIAAGLEALGARWDFRLNGYLPVGSKLSSRYDKTLHVSDGTFDAFSGNYLLISQTVTKKWKKEYAMKGLDAEAAFHFLKYKNFDLYAAAGPYYYNYKNKQAIGGQARIGAQIYEYLSLELINSYDSRFHENFQGQIGVNIPFGPRKKNQKLNRCKNTSLLSERFVQDVKRQEIIVVDRFKKRKVTDVVSIAIDPLTGNPYFFVFVDNTSSSLGTFNSPYPTFALAEANSKPGDIIYVFPGNGTTKGMDSGIALQADQNLWGSGISHSLETTVGDILIPPQSSSSPTITNTDLDTDGNAITLSNNNDISGFTIASTLNDAIFGTDSQNLNVSFCTFENISTYPIEASFPGNASISVMNNQFLGNANGILLTLAGTTNVVCSNNSFENQTSVSSIPLEISATGNVLLANVENNVFNNNTTGSIRFDLNNVLEANINVNHNTITNNGTGSESSLGSSFVVLSLGTIDNCSIALSDNTFSNNASSSLYLHTSGAFTNLNIAAFANTMTNNGSSALVIATPITDALTLFATDNTVAGINDNGMAIISAGTTSIGNIIINNNSITDIGNTSNGIAINQDFSILSLTIQNNEINGCEGTGITSFAPDGIDSLTVNISGNTISNCQNLSSNAAGGLDIEQYITLEGSVTNNILINDTDPAVVISSSLTTPTTCLTLTGNETDTSYLLGNPSGLFNLSPCDADTANVGTINPSGTITPVQSCPEAAACPP